MKIETLYRIILYGQSGAHLQLSLCRGTSKSFRQLLCNQVPCKNGEEHILKNRAILLEERQLRFWAPRIAEAAHQYLVILRSGLATLQETFKYTSPSQRQGYRWQELSLLLIAGFLMDLGVGQRLHHQGVIRHRPQDWWLWCFERGEKDDPVRIFGVRIWHSAPLRAGIGEVWHVHERTMFAFKDADIRLLLQSAQGNLSNRISNNSRERARILKLRVFGVMRTPHELNIPAFSPNDVEVLWPPIWDLAEKIVNRAVVPQFEGLLPPSLFPTAQGERSDAYRQAFYRLLMESAFYEAYQSGLFSHKKTWQPHNRCWLWWEHEKQSISLGRWLGLW